MSQSVQNDEAMEFQPIPKHDEDMTTANTPYVKNRNEIGKLHQVFHIYFVFITLPSCALLVTFDDLQRADRHQK